jgi:1-acyl-sn-glycerol-3-phosphate acyltransferase
MKKSSYIIIYFIVFWILIPGILILTSIILHHAIFQKTMLSDSVVIPGFILAGCGLSLIFLAIYQFRSFSGEYPVSATPPAKIIQRGLFAIWRHPIYLFAMILLAGAAMILRSKAMLFIVFPSFMVLAILYIINEESVLLKRFGRQYIQYRKNVPLIIPHLRHWLIIPAFFMLRTKFRLKVINRENIPSDLPFIVISGHRHYLDPLFITYAIPVPLKQISTFEMFRSPLNRRIFRWFGAIPRRRYMKDIAGTRKIISTLRSGYPVCMFPEGGRSWTGRLRTFKIESIRLLQHLHDIPVVPVRIEGNYHSWPRWADHMTQSRVTVTIEEPVLIDRNSDPSELENLLRKMVEPDQQTEDSKLYLSKNRIDGISKVLYRCPVCLNYEAPEEIPPDTLYCPKCREFFYLRTDLKLEFRQNENTIIKSIFETYNIIKIRFSDIYKLLPEILVNQYSGYIGTEERLVYLSPCQLWNEKNSVFRKSIKGLCLLSDKTITIFNEKEKSVIHLDEINAATIESNYKLQVYNDITKILHQITFDDDSALKYQDLLEVIIKGIYRKQIITR